MTSIKDDCTSKVSTTDEAPGLNNYYDNFDNPEIAEGFHNLDDPRYLDGHMQKVRSVATSDFTVAFNDDDAYVAFDLSLDAYTELLESEKPSALSARWINIWYPFQHRPLLELLAKKYDFSPRLLALMGTDPGPARRSPSSMQSQPSSRRFWTRKAMPPPSDVSQTEKGPDEVSELSSLASYDSSFHNNLYRLVNEIWHYTSVDFGRNYMCLGYNSLYGVAPAHDHSTDEDGHLPHCTRVWTWLVLCDDSTVITINEDIFPHAQHALTIDQLRVLAETRRNLVNVFRSLSTVDNDPLEADNPMTLLPIRARLGSTPEETLHRETNAPGLLFYYLFENWQNSYTLITRKESRYGVELEQLRKQMFVSPKLDHIDRLHRVGQELGVLRRHYESYNRIIDRVLEPRPSTAASLQNSRVAGQPSETSSLNTVRPVVVVKESSLGVSISSAARVRFQRLKDLIDLYALEEVEEYLRSVDSLTKINFSLLTLKESLDVERLTRITLLLTKATFFFLPVNFMAQYFGIQLHDTEYTIEQFWVSFLIVLLISLGALYVFGVFSGTVQMMTLAGPISRHVGMVGGWFRRRVNGKKL